MPSPRREERPAYEVDFEALCDRCQVIVAHWHARAVRNPNSDTFRTEHDVDCPLCGKEGS